MEVHTMVVEMYQEAVENNNNYLEVYEKIIRKMPRIKVRVEIPQK